MGKPLSKKLVFDIEMEWDNKRASQTDDVAHCLDYASVSHAIIEYVEKRRFELVERVAEESGTATDNTVFLYHVSKIKLAKPGR